MLLGILIIYGSAQAQGNRGNRAHQDTTRFSGVEFSISTYTEPPENR
jgi:hypothetical protein